MVSVAQLVRASDCGSEGRGFESHYPPHKRNGIGRRSRSHFFFLHGILGCSQAVRHGTLTPAFVGSSPTIPARFDPLAQSAEQLPFKQWARGSNPRRVTSKKPCNRNGCRAFRRAFYPQIPRPFRAFPGQKQGRWGHFWGHRSFLPRRGPPSARGPPVRHETPQTKKGDRHAGQQEYLEFHEAI